MDNVINLPYHPEKCMPAHIKRWAPPECPIKAVIPLVEVMKEEEIKSLSNCFVYVLTTNKTFYIDNQHRFILCWAGPVFQDNYDVETNPLGIRGQFVPDFENNKVIIYNNTGEHFELGQSELASISDADWATLWS